MSKLLRRLGSATAMLFCCTSLLISAQQVDLSARVFLSRDGSQWKGAHPENVVFWLTAIGSPTRDKVPLAIDRKPRLTQHHKSFEPHVLVIPVGSVVEFPNRDPIFHNVFSLFDGKRFDLGLYEAGSTRDVRFDRAGVSYIFCNIHAEMSAVVIALDTPYFGISNQRGEIVIPNVPAGRYRLRIWQESASPGVLNALTRDITVSKDSPALGIFRIPVATPALAHKNKYGVDYDPPTPSSPAYENP